MYARMQAVRETWGKPIIQHLQLPMVMPSLPMAMPSLAKAGARAKGRTYSPQSPPFLTPTTPSPTRMDSHQLMAQRQLSEQMLLEASFAVFWLNTSCMKTTVSLALQVWPYKLVFGMVPRSWLLFWLYSELASGVLHHCASFRCCDHQGLCWFSPFFMVLHVGSASLAGSAAAAAS